DSSVTGVQTCALPISFAVSGHGITIRDSAGKEYIDASGGAAVSCLGHSHPDVLRAMREQVDKLAYAHTSFFTTQVAEELADDLEIGRASCRERVGGGE